MSFLKLYFINDFFCFKNHFQCYFGNNRASIEHHENGLRHKAALAAKIRDLGKARTDKDLQVENVFFCFNLGKLSSFGIF